MQDVLRQTKCHPNRMWVVQDCDRFNGPSTKCRMCYVKQSVVLTGRNTTGPPSHAAPWLVTLHRHGVLQTTSDANEQHNTPPPYTVCRRASIKAVCVCVANRQFRGQCVCISVWLWWPSVSICVLQPCLWRQVHQSVRFSVTYWLKHWNYETEVKRKI